ncbi:MAG: hypothetical protein LRY36_02350 [Alphaproteobacteria bacterium]|nr:hypothetical protein [Alphaproteobacteria bacterium]
MTNEHFIQQLVIERFKFHLAHLTALLHTQSPVSSSLNTLSPDTGDNAISPEELGFENASALLRAMNEDLSLLERCLEQKMEAIRQG